MELGPRTASPPRPRASPGGGGELRAHAGKGLGGPGAGPGGVRVGVPAATAPASCPLAVFLRARPARAARGAGHVVRSLAPPLPRYPWVSALASHPASLSPFSDPRSLPSSVPVPRVLSRPPSGDTTGGRLKPVDRSPSPLPPSWDGDSSESPLCSPRPCPSPSPPPPRAGPGLWD